MSLSLPRSAAGCLALGLVALCLAVFAAPSGCAEATPCQFNSDCPVGYCSGGTCKEDCVVASRDCPSGDVCNANAQCVPGSTGTGGTGGTTSSSTSGTGTTTSSSSSGGGASTSSSSVSSSTSGISTSTSSSATSSTSSTGGTTSAHELDPCASDGECAAPLVCRALVPGGATVCTRTCASNAACMTGTVCELIGGTHYCAADDTGRQCTAASECNFGCLTPGVDYCTVACATGADCPNGYGCAGIGTPAVRVCVKAEAPCDASDTSACIAAAACDDVLPTQVLVGSCTLPCSSLSDCPVRASGFASWSCDAGGICRRPPDVFGPLPTGATPAQYTCDDEGDVVNLCNDAQHIDFMAFDVPPDPQVTSCTTITSGIPTDSCVDSCRYQGGCPFGFACVALGSVDNGQSRVGLCMPTGGGNVGAPCSYPGDCAYGYCTLSGTCSRDCTADGVCPAGSSCVAGGGPDVEGQPFRKCQ